jgi:hypothetical protein
MSSYGNYLQGSTDSTNNTYNLLISGAPGGYTSSGINIGGDTATTYGVKLTADSTHNAFMDVRGDASNKIAFRHKDQTSGTVTAMLDLTNDSSLTGTGYGATVNGRVNASSYYVGTVDTRAPTSTGVYMGTDGNVGYFNINKGSGTGGFAFKTYNADGTLLQSNLNLMASGIVNASYYTSTGNAADSESVAVAGFDASGNIVRLYQSNERFRTIEARMTAAESSVNGPVSSKVNEIITRLNGLNFFSQNIETIAATSGSTPSAPSGPTPVVSYPFNGSTTDVAGGATNQFVVNGNYYYNPSNPAGSPGTITYVNGHNSNQAANMISAQLNANYNFPMSGFTFTAWIYSKGYGNSINLYGTGISLFFQFQSSNGSMNLFNNNGGDIYFTGSTNYTNTWIHVALTYSSSGTLQLYVNGVSVATVSSLSLPQISSYFIGFQYPGYEWNGYLQNVAIYASVLTSSQVTTVMNQ